ncbi:MAG: beta-phosphoglucomutase [Bacteroidetes bacterium]|nr:beta-phosphoglucomutase [Bacteroidota bacterium]
MKIKAFLFDLDGVIVDTAIFHYQAWKKMANGLGFDIDEEFNETLKGISRMDSLNAILKHGNLEISEEQKLELAAQKNADYLELVNTMTPANILPGVSSFLAEARESGVKIALGSASKNSNLILEKIGVKPLFDAIIDGNQVSKSKPDPEVFVKGAQSLGFENESCIVFEDAFAGVEAAKAANMKAVGIGSSKVLFNADIVINSFEGHSVSEFLNL